MPLQEPQRIAAALDKFGQALEHRTSESLEKLLEDIQALPLEPVEPRVGTAEDGGPEFLPTPIEELVARHTVASEHMMYADHLQAQAAAMRRAPGKLAATPLAQKLV